MSLVQGTFLVISYILVYMHVCLWLGTKTIYQWPGCLSLVKIVKEMNEKKKSNVSGEMNLYGESQVYHGTS